jgi:prepilin-type processing-associated H-X9-DG protein
VNGSTEWTGSRSRHPGGVQVTMCDGSVHFIAQNVGLNEWRAMGSIGNGDQVTF